MPRDGHSGRRGHTLGFRCRQPLDLRPGALQALIQAALGDRLPLQLAANAAHFRANLVYDALGLVSGRLQRLVPLAAGLATFFVRGGERDPGPILRDACLGQRLSRLDLGRLDRSQRLLERLLLVGQARPRVGDDRSRQTQPLGDRESLAAPGQSDRQPEGRSQGLDVELDRGVSRLRSRMRVQLEFGVVGRSGDQSDSPLSRCCRQEW